MEQQGSAETVDGAILVVDDDPEFAALLAGLVESDGYRVRVCGDASSTIGELERAAPDLILLDVRLPDLSGFELTERIKRDPIWSGIRVMLVSGLSGDDYHVRGLDSGADDYVQKPIRPEIVLSRVRRQLQAKRIHDELARSRDRVAMQCAEMKQVDKAKDNLVHMLVHDLKSPLGALELGVDLLQKLNGDATHPLGSTTLRNIDACTTKLSTMVQNILLVSQMEQAGVRLEPTEVALSALLEANEAYHGSLASGRSQTWSTEYRDGGRRVTIDVNLISRVIDNLVSNACRLSPKGADLLLRIESVDDGVQVTVGDRGPGVPPEMQDRIFDKFVSGTEALRTKGANQGLGLTFSKLAVEAHGGTIAVEPRDGGGSLFVFVLPAVPTAPARDDATAPCEAVVA